jgi:Carboxypeptidase regulatory-like domain
VLIDCNDALRVHADKNRATIIGELLHRLKWLIFFFPALSGVAQVSTTNVTGIVQDASSASIGDASVKLINVQTGTENDSKTNNDGRFALPGVIPGDYTLQIERGGFATTQVNGIILNVGDTKQLLIRLKVGSVSESVNVDASGLTLSTTDAAVSTLVDRKFVSNIPLNGRSFQDLIFMTPGIVTQSPQAATQSSSTQPKLNRKRSWPEYVIPTIVCLVLGLAPLFNATRIPAFTLYAALFLCGSFPSRSLDGLKKDS